MKAEALAQPAGAGTPNLGWRQIVHTILLSRALDEIEETRLFPARKVLYQFTARGHDVSQVLLGRMLTGRRDAVGVYYRSRPLMLSLGLTVDDALASTMMRSGGVSEGRDIGVVFNLPRSEGACALPACGGVGAQYTPTAGWAQAILYHSRVLHDPRWQGSIAVAHGGDASTATNGFWSALNIATTQSLPMLFCIEDNGYGISVKSHLQTPGGNIAENLASFRNLRILDADSVDPRGVAFLLQDAIGFVRSGAGPALLRIVTPRLSGHSGQDTQAYKSPQEIAAERSRDPLSHLRRQLVPKFMADSEWLALEQRARDEVEQALARVEQRTQPQPAQITRYAFSERRADGTLDVQAQGGLLSAEVEPPAGAHTPRPEGSRINMLTAIRRTLEHELEINPRVVVFGEDVGRKGGVHAATLGLQEKFGEARVFDTSLSEEGIIGRAVGMALAGLMPVPEIQFRKYADPAQEQLNDCGTIRWRTANRFAAPMVVRMPGGFFKCGDPWHSQSNEVQFAHAIGWRIAMPSNAEDAVGLLRAALRGNDPTIFFEHRSMLDAACARRPWPGNDFVLPFGKAKLIREGSELTVVTWGAMVERCEEAAMQSAVDVEILDLRTLMPWDKEAVLVSVRKTHRCLIVHEDNVTAGFGAEIAATLASEGFFDLDAPIERLAMADVPSPHSPLLLDAVVPDASRIAHAIRALASL
ncbi:MAG TPA: transketolase C-terminal domain-containing protein [Steroidobacter sp.]|jgi:2-oxoisovalerate dehydrogenase E1 component|nr:transketolase C-terminal domain-containing protein [Steroidobacter sp.]